MWPGLFPQDPRWALSRPLSMTQRPDHAKGTTGYWSRSTWTRPTLSSTSSTQRGPNGSGMAPKHLRGGNDLLREASLLLQVGTIYLSLGHWTASRIPMVTNTLHVILSTDHYSFTTRGIVHVRGRPRATLLEPGPDPTSAPRRPPRPVFASKGRRPRSPSRS